MRRRACCARRRPGECGCGGFRLCFDCGHENLLVVCLRSWIGAQTQKPRTHGGVRGSSRSVPATIGGAVFGYTNQLADGEIIIRTICSRALPAMTSLLSYILRGHHVGTEPTPSHPASPSFIHIVRQLHLRYGWLGDQAATSSLLAQRDDRHGRAHPSERERDRRP